MRDIFQTKTLLINLLTALILALALELILGLALRNPTFIPDFLIYHYSKFYESQDRDILQVTDCAEYDPDLFYRFKPGDCIFENREFRVVNSFNSRGLRDDEESLDHPSIVVLGDSFTQGWGVPQSEAYPQQLEVLCGQKVLNAGVSSFGTARQMKLLRMMDLKHIETVIIQYHPNDFEENLISIKNHFILPIRTEKTYDEITKRISDRNRYFPFKYLTGISKGVVRSIILPEEKMPTRDTLEAQAFLDILLDAGLYNLASRIFVFKIDDVNNTDGFVDAIDYFLTKDRYARLNIITVPIEGLLSKKDFFILDTHIRESGHEKLALTLNDHLNRSNEEYPLIVRVNREDQDANVEEQDGIPVAGAGADDARP